jgi:hypothetical protein
MGLVLLVDDVLQPMCLCSFILLIVEVSIIYVDCAFGQIQITVGCMLLFINVMSLQRVSLRFARVLICIPDQIPLFISRVRPSHFWNHIQSQNPWHGS